MHFSSLLLGLAATASAIDIRGHALDSCNGSYRACTNINPRVCCIFSESASSGRVSVDVVAVRGIPLFFLFLHPISFSLHEKPSIM